MVQEFVVSKWERNLLHNQRAQALGLGKFNWAIVGPRDTMDIHAHASHESVFAIDQSIV